MFGNFKENKFFLILLFSISLTLQFFVISDVINRTVNNWSLAFWLTSIVFLYLSIPFGLQVNKDDKPKESAKTIVFATIIIFCAVLIRVVLMFNTQSFHIDEYLSAHFAYSLGDITKLDWFAVYPPAGVWICQFPLPYFLFQKIFFNIFDISTLSMRFSILPYIIMIFASLFLYARKIFGDKASLLSIIFLAVFPADLYLSRWSLHFISSTAFFFAALYFFILCVKNGNKIYFGLFGIFLGLCYFTYYSSYIALPLFIIYLLLLILFKQIKINHLKGFLISALIFLFFLSPLITYALKVNNFITQRTDQVAIINGLWSEHKNVKPDIESYSGIILKQADLSLRSLYIDNIGGHAGYWFGRLAFFDKITFFIFIFSFFYFILKSIKSKSAHYLFPILVVACAFFTGIVFTIPPPAFHRMSIAYPLITLIIGVSIADFYVFLKEKNKTWAFIIVLILIVSILAGNIYHFSRILKTDGPDDPDFPPIQNELTIKHAEMVYIASFDSYSLGKVLFIRSDKKIKSMTHPLNDLISQIPKGKVSYLIVVYPNEETNNQIMANFPKSTVIKNYGRHELIEINN